MCDEPDLGGSRVFSYDAAVCCSQTFVQVEFVRLFLLVPPVTSFRNVMCIWKATLIRLVWQQSTRLWMVVPSSHKESLYHLAEWLQPFPKVPFCQRRSSVSGKLFLRHFRQFPHARNPAWYWWKPRSIIWREGRVSLAGVIHTSHEMSCRCNLLKAVTNLSVAMSLWMIRACAPLEGELISWVKDWDCQWEAAEPKILKQTGILPDTGSVSPTLISVFGQVMRV